MSLLRLAISGSCGLLALMSSLLLILAAVDEGISGMMFLILPPGIVFLAALLIIDLNCFSAVCTFQPFAGSARLSNRSSVKDVNLVQSAFSKLIKFLKSLFIGEILVLILMIIGR